MNPSKISHLLCAILSCLILVQCSSINPERKAAIKKVVVATDVRDEIARYHVGLTVFTNKTYPIVKDTRLTAGVRRVLEEETRNRLPSVVFATESLPKKPRSMFKSADYKSWAMEAARKHQADAVLIVLGRNFYPYGAPPYMKAEGMGIWHTHVLGKSAQVECYLACMILDPSGNPLTIAPATGGTRILPNIESKESFSSYSPQQQEMIINEALSSYRAVLSGYLSAIGF